MKINIPRLSIEFVEGSSKSEVTLLSVGIGLHQAWTYSCMYGAESVFDIPSLPVLHGYTYFFIESIIVFSLCLLIFGFLDEHVRKHLINSKALIAGGICMVLGTLAVALCPLLATGTPIYVASFIGGLLTGVGSAVVFIFWGMAMSLLDYHSLVLNIAISLLITILIYAVGLQLIPIPVRGFIAALLPVLECIILLQKNPSFFRGTSRVPVFTPLPIKRASFFLHYAIPLLFFGFAAGLLKGNAIIKILSDENINSLFLLLGAALAFIYIAFFITSDAKDRDIMHTFKRIVPMAALAAFLIPFSTNYVGADWLNIFITSGFLCLEAMFFLYFNEMSQGFRLSPIYIYGIGRGIIALAAVGGSFMSIQRDFIVSSLPWGDSGGVVFTLMALVLGFCTLPSKNAIERAALNTCSLTFYYKRDGIKGNSGSNTLGSNVNLDGLGADQGTQTPQPAAQKPSPAPTAASSAAMATEDARTATGTIDDPIPQNELLQVQCEAIANCYLLSQRETEVFYYLAKGYNSSRIQEVLFISEGTAKTHIRHIYRKLGIHSQQDLIRMVDDTIAES